MCLGTDNKNECILFQTIWVCCFKVGHWSKIKSDGKVKGKGKIVKKNQVKPWIHNTELNVQEGLKFPHNGNMVKSVGKNV